MVNRLKIKPRNKNNISDDNHDSSLPDLVSWCMVYYFDDKCVEREQLIARVVEHCKNAAKQQEK